MSTHVIATDKFGRNSLKEVVIHDTEFLNNQARLAVDLISRWGMIAAKIDGEDTACRSKLAELTPQEVVDRACEIADITIDTFRTKDWIVEGPSVEDLLRKTDD